MTSCSIIISHYESVEFLRTCVRWIETHPHPEIEQKIIIADQSCSNTYVELIKEFSGIAEIIHMEPLWSGFGIDYIMRYGNVKTDYICQIHTDVLPICKNWLYLPIKLIEKYEFSFVGQTQFFSRPSDNIYPPDMFFGMAQCFNVARLETYKELALKAGFTRFENRDRAGMQWDSGYWSEWAKTAINKGWSDDDVIAFHWEDKFREHNKLGLAITGYIAPPYCRIIEDLVFHFGSCREALGIADRLPQEYWNYAQRIKEDYSDELVEEMVERARANRVEEQGLLGRIFWDGYKKEAIWPIDKSLAEDIETLKLLV